MNNKLTLTCLVSAMLVTMAATASAGTKALSEYDTNGDGTVTSAEITAVKTADFNTADVDTSGSLTLAEYLNLEATVQTRRISTAFKSLDTDSSSGISLTEFTTSTSGTTATYLNNVFKLADKDADSALSLAEFTELQSKGANSGIWEFARMDTTVDQLLSLAEYTAVPTAPTGNDKGGKGGKR